jgi:23S rRNA pseudouridine955/2504/2580 synthase
VAKRTALAGLALQCGAGRPDYAAPRSLKERGRRVRGNPRHRQGLRPIPGRVAAADYKQMHDLSKDSVNWLVVGEAAEGQRIDNFLVRTLKGVPKSHIYRILRSGEVRLNRRRVGPETRLVPGDRLRIPPIRAAAPAVPAPRGAAAGSLVLPILFEDEALVALDKPAGIAVHGGSGISHGLIESLRQARPGARFLELVHRLDRGTSGVLLVAKRKAALTGLHAQLREGRVDKRYVVLVRGKWGDAVRTVELPLHKYVTGEGERRVRVGREGRAACTEFRLLHQWPDAVPPVALLEARLDTGRTHQIRVHLTHIGHPLAGDDKYGDFAWNRALAKQGLRRMFLHARSIRFIHPLAGTAVAVESPLPDELAQFLARLDAKRETNVDA